jgi:hypothetical protein
MITVEFDKGLVQKVPRNQVLKIKLEIDKVDIDQIRREVEPFVKDAAALAIWSKEFFMDVASRIKIV